MVLESIVPKPDLFQARRILCIQPHYDDNDIAAGGTLAVRFVPYVTFPLAVGGDPPVGALALNTVSSPRDWPDEIVNRLRLVAQVFANALARKRLELKLP